MVGQRLAVLFFFHYVDATAAVRGVSLAPRELPSLSIIYFFYPAENPQFGLFYFLPSWPVLLPAVCSQEALPFSACRLHASSPSLILSAPPGGRARRRYDLEATAAYKIRPAC